MPAARASRLGIHRNRVRARSAGNRQGSAAPRWPASSRTARRSRLPDDDPLPAPLEIGVDVRDQILYLAVPLRRAGELDAVRDAAVRRPGSPRRPSGAGRRRPAAGGDPAMLEVGALRTRLLLAKDVTDAYACIPLAHIVECRADRQVVLDEQFIPTVLHVRAASRLAAFTSELLGLLHQRGEALAGRVAATGPRRRRRVRRLSDAAGDQPIRADRRALRRRRLRAS